MTTIDAYLPRPDELSAPVRRVDAANQRDAWLRQMELAQLAQMGSSAMPGAPNAALAPQASTRGPMQAGGATLSPPSTQLATPAATATSSAAGSASAPAAGATQAHADTRAAGAAVGDAAVGDAAAGDAAAGDNAGDDASAGAKPAAIVAGALAAPAPPVIAGPPPPPTDANAAGGVPGALAGLAMAAVGGASAMAEPPGVQPMPPGLIATAPTVSSATPATANNAAAPDADADAKPGAPADASEVPEWQKRVMHLTGDGDEVHLWIRDQALSPAQTEQLVMRLAGDVAAMGMRLKEATVNGKPTLRPGARAAAQSERVAHLDQPSDQTIIHPTTER